MPGLRIGVAITAYRHERFIGEAIESVLAQTRPADEIVVLDDASDDRTAEIAESCDGVRVIRSERNLGMRANNARAHEAVGTELVAVLDGDDRMRPHRLERTAAAFSADPTLRMVGGLTQQIDAHGRPFDDPLGEPGMLTAMDFLRRGSLVIHGALTLRRPIVPHDARIHGVSDWKMVVDNLRGGGRCLVLDEVIAEWRRHPDQSTQATLLRNRHDNISMCDLVAGDAGWSADERRAAIDLGAVHRLLTAREVLGTGSLPLGARLRRTVPLAMAAVTTSRGRIVTRAAGSALRQVRGR